LGRSGFRAPVAIKTLHPQFAKDPEFVEMFLEEARLASRIQHPNVISTLDVATGEGEVFLVMEYVAGESLAKLVRARSRRAS
jgi:serine/threonine-protein kinase